MHGSKAGLLTRDLILKPLNVLLRLGDSRLRTGYLRLKLRHFQHCEGLTLAHAVADIHINAADVSRQLTVNGDLLEWLKYAGHRELIRNRTSLCCCSRNGGWDRSGLPRIGILAPATDKEHDQQYSRNTARGGDQQAPEALLRSFSQLELSGLRIIERAHEVAPVP